MKRAITAFFVTTFILMGSLVLYKTSSNYRSKQNPPQNTPAVNNKTEQLRTIEVARWGMTVPGDWHYYECFDHDQLWIGKNIDGDQEIEDCGGPYDANIIISRQTKIQLPRLPYSNSQDIYDIKDTELTIDGVKAIDRQVYFKGSLIDREIFVEQREFIDRFDLEM